jgi:diguanylate cyclase (GGDEF)-like protein
MKSSLKNKRVFPQDQDFLVKPAACLHSLAHQSHPALTVLDLMPQLVWLKTKSQQYFCNQALCKYIGKTLNLFVSDTWQSFIHPEDREQLLCLWQQASVIGENFTKECRIKNIEQRYQWFKVNIQYHPNPNLEWMITCDNIHAYVVQRKLYKQQLLNQQKFLDTSADCIKVLTPDGRLNYINQFGREALFMPHQDVNNLSWLSLLDANVQAQGQHALAEAQQGKRARFSGITQQPGHPPYYWDNLLTPMLNEQGEVKKILCISRDMSQQRLTERRLEYAYTFDDLTQLYNRRSFNNLLERAIQQAADSTRNVGLIMLDLDYFKNLNDTLGHLAGDHLLKVFAYRLRKAFSKPLLVARFGNDEFAVIVPDLESSQQLIDYAKHAAAQIDAPIYYAGQYINGGMSIGCASYPKDAKNASHLIRCADTALNDLKQTGRGGILLFNEHMLNTLQHSAQQMNLAREILRNDSIIPYYQPKVSLANSKIIGFETLLRWRDQDNQIYTPAHIEEAFEDYELATRLSEAMQRKVFSDLQHCIQNNIPLYPIAINAAPVEFLRDNYAETLLTRLAEYQLSPQLIEIEITEQSLEARGAAYVLRALEQLKQAGIRIALDDFGTGHSSLTRLKDYPIDILKIDRSFIEKMHHDPAILAIVTAIGQLGPKIQIEILAEGIENAEHVSTLQQCQCSSGQGFYFYRPMPIQALKQLMLQIN